MDGQHAIARRMVVGLPPGGLTPIWERDFAQFPPAGVILFARDFPDLESARGLIQRLRSLVRPRRLLVALDEEGGWVSQLAGHLLVPPNAALLARGAGPGDLAWIAEVTARRLRAIGFDWNFAPVADVDSEPDNPVIGPRAYGTTAAEVSGRVAQVLDGFHRGQVASCLKHFPGHGDTRLDSHLALPVCDRDAATLDARELVPFVANMARAESVMTAHVLYPALDPGQPGTFSRPIMTTLLRERFGFRGLVVTDALEMQGAARDRTPAEVGALALEAGADLLLYATAHEDVRRARLTLGDQLVDGAIDRAAYDDARPRLERFAALHPEPSPEELTQPIEAVTPPEWETRLGEMIAAGLRVEGSLPAAARQGAWRVDAPEFAHGEPFAATLVAEGVRLADDGVAQVVVVCSRTPLTAGILAGLRRRATERPTILVGLQNDGFLQHVPEAALRVSACDATPLTRRLAARRLAALRSTG